jgi:hypothetical protein
MVKARPVDERRRIVLPPEFQPGSEVILEQLDQHTWLLQRYQPDRNLKLVLIPVIDRLPDDAAWGKVERAFGRAAYKKLRLSVRSSQSRRHGPGPTQAT